MTRAVRMISGPSEISELGKLKEVEKLFQWEEQVIELQKGKDELPNRREVTGKEKENSVISLLEEKGNKELTSENKEMSKNLNGGEMEEFITDRSKSSQEIETQIARLAEKFQELERNQVPTPEEMSFVSLRIWTHIHQKVMILRKWKFRQLQITIRRKEERKRGLLR